MPPSYLVRQRPLRTKSTLTTPNEEAAEVVTPLSGRCPRRNPSRTTRCSTDLENTKVSSFNENRVFSANYQPYIKIWKIRKSRIDFFFIVRILLGWLVTSNYFYYSYARFGDFSFGKRNNFLLHRLTTNPIPWKPRYTACVVQYQPDRMSDDIFPDTRAPSAMARYENLSWSGVWIKPMRKFRISRRMSLMTTFSGPSRSI